MADSSTLSDVHKMKVAELKKVLKDRGLPTSGNKTELVERLLAIGDNALDSSVKELLEEERLLDDSTDVLGDSPVKVNDPTLVPAATSLTTIVSHSLHVNKSVKPTASSTPASVDSVAADAMGNLAQTKQLPSTPSASGKIESRLKRFGVVSEDARKTARLERFLSNSASGGAKSTTDSLHKPAANGNTLQKRAERFGVAVSAADAVQQKTVAASGSNDRLLKRAERFGQASSTASGASVKGDEQERILKRKARFAGSVIGDGGVKSSSGVTENEAEQKKRRLERFGTVAVK